MSDPHLLCRGHLERESAEHTANLKSLIRLSAIALVFCAALVLVAPALMEFDSIIAAFAWCICGLCGPIFLLVSAIILIAGVVAWLRNPYRRMLRTGKFVIIRCKAIRLLEYEYASGEDYTTSQFTEYAYHDGSYTFTFHDPDLFSLNRTYRDFFTVLEKRGSWYHPHLFYRIAPSAIMELSDELKPYYVDKPLSIHMKCPIWAERSPSVTLVEEYTDHTPLTEQAK